MAHRTKGRLLATAWLPDDTQGNQICFTCQYHGIDRLTPATDMRVRQYQRRIKKTYFCAEHVIGAKVAEVANV